MSKDNSEKTKQALDKWSSSRLSTFFQVSAYTVTTMAVLGGGGYLLDRLLFTYPIFFMIGLIVSFPLVQVLLYKKFKKYAEVSLEETPAPKKKTPKKSKK